MSKISATDRMARLIAAIPWIVDQDGALVDEISERFDYPRDLLLQDLQDVVFYVGVPPYTPDTLIEVTIDDDMVWISYADWFSRPMRLSGSEILSLLAAGEAALAFDNQDEAGALARGLTKLRLATGSDTETVDMQFGLASENVLPVLRGAAEQQMCVDIAYYSFAQDERTERRIEPRRFFVDQGNWYVAGFCHRASSDRIFRVDRIESAETTAEAFTSATEASPDEPMFSIEEAPRASVLVPNARLYLLDGLPVDLIEHGDDAAAVTLPVSSTRWLQQLMIRVGPGVRLLSTSDEAMGSGLPDAVERIMLRHSTS